MAKAKKRPTKKNIKRAVQVSFDQRVLKEIDDDIETQTAGRSAFIMNAVLMYLRAKRAKEIDDNLIATLGPVADDIFAESLPFMNAQVWPPEDDLVKDGPVQAPSSHKRAG